MSVPKVRIDVTVSHGIVTLRGNVEWRFQRQAAENAVCDLASVIDVVNMISIKPRPSGKLVKSQPRRLVASQCDQSQQPFELRSAT